MTTSQTRIDTYFSFEHRFAKFSSKRLAAAIPGAVHPGNEPQAAQPHSRLPCLHYYGHATRVSAHDSYTHYFTCQRQAAPSSHRGARGARGRGRGRGGRGRPGQGKRAGTPLEEPAASKTKVSRANG